jgi:hypothetical protein
MSCSATATALGPKTRDEGRQAARRFLFSATLELFDDLGFERVRQVGKHARVVSRHIEAVT